MIAFDLYEDVRELGESLKAEYPSEVMVLDGRSIDGTTETWTLFISSTGMAITAIQNVLTSIIQSKKCKTFTYKGMKFSGYSENEIISIIAEINKSKKTDTD
jgi:hypothetical protein